MNFSNFFPSLFADQAGAKFHFYVPWIIFCALTILIPIYYALEGRKRFFGHHALNKYVLDKFMSYLWPIGLVGLVLVGARAAEMAIFSWRFWRYGWALWALAFFGYWAYYFAFQYRYHLAAYRAQRTKERYMPPSRSKRRQVAGAR